MACGQLTSFSITNNGGPPVAFWIILVAQPISPYYYTHYYKNAYSECMPVIPIVIPILIPALGIIREPTLLQSILAYVALACPIYTWFDYGAGYSVYVSVFMYLTSVLQSLTGSCRVEQKHSDQPELTPCPICRRSVAVRPPADPSLRIDLFENST